MSHLDPELLALLALGEPAASDADREHLARCGSCSAELDELTHAVGVGRSTISEGSLERPPAVVWDRITTELDLTQSPEGLGRPVEASTSDTVTSPGESPAKQDGESASAAEAGETGQGHSRRLLWTLAASTALVLALGGAWAVGSMNTRPIAIATAALEAFPAHPEATGSAEVAQRQDGERTLTVNVDASADPEQYREVWLIRNDGEALISLGILDAEESTFVIPEGLDLADYGLVDISFEPLDGDPAHSGDSIVRGALDFL